MDIPKTIVTKTDTNALRVHVHPKKNEFWLLLRSDVHHDNPHCDLQLELKHLKEAKERGALILDLGDLFCAMQGKYDKRSSKSSIRKEHLSGHYFDSLVSDAADFYEPYAKNFLAFGKGNHETSVLDRHETDLTQRLVGALNDRTKSHIHSLGYTGWLRFVLEIRGTKTSRTLWFTHGYGGGGPVTEDIIQSARQRLYVEADIMCSGHVHRSWTQEYVSQRLGKYGEITTRQGTYIKLPTYKDSYGKGEAGFEVEKGMGPRPKGAYWIRFYTTRIANNSTELNYDVIKAN